MNFQALIVDDDPGIRMMVKDLLGSVGIDVCEAANGHMALDLIKRNVPSMIIIDINMPLMDGVTLVETLHRAGYPTSRILVCSGTITERRLARLAQLKVEHFLVKPYVPGSFIEKVRSFQTLQESA